MNTLARIDRVTGYTIAAATPATARHAMSPVEPLLSAPPTDAIKNTPSPMSSIGRRPKRSLSEPPASTRAANAKLNASTIHSRSRVDAPISVASVGSAILMIVVETFTTNTAIQSVMSTAVLFTDPVVDRRNISIMKL